MAKRLLCVVLSLLMIMAVLPTGVVADDTYTEWTKSSSLPTSGTYKLTCNVKLSVTSGFSSTPACTLKGDLTIDLNGYSITYSGNTSDYVTSYLFSIGSYTLTIEDSSEGGTGEILITGGCGFDVGSGGILNITGGTIEYQLSEAQKSYYLIYNDGGTVNISGGSIVDSTTKNISADSYLVYNNSGTVLISGGTFDNSSSSNSKSQSIYSSTDDGVSITGGDFSDTKTTDTSYESYISDGYELSTDGEVVKSTVAPTLYGRSLSLGTQIGVNYYFSFDGSDYDAADCYVVFTVGGTTQTAQLTANGSYYVATCKVYLYQMALDISAQLYDASDKVGDEYTGYSIKQYYSNMSGSDNTELNNLLVALLNYGGFGQTYLDKNTTVLANDGVTDNVTSVTVDNLSEYQATYSGSNIITPTLIVGDTDSIVIKFYISNYSEDYTITIDGKTATAQTDDGSTYYVVTDEILVQNWGNSVEVIISSGDEEVSKCDYSVLSYAYSVLSVATDETYTENLKNFVRSMYVYNQAELAYIG